MRREDHPCPGMTRIERDAPTPAEARARLDERDRRAAADTPTEVLMGDPPSGRSARAAPNSTQRSLKCYVQALSGGTHEKRMDIFRAFVLGRLRFFAIGSMDKCQRLL